MLISGFTVKNGKGKCFSHLVNPSKLLPALFVGFSIWHVLTASGMELTGHKDWYDVWSSLKLDKDDISYPSFGMSPNQLWVKIIRPDMTLP